MSPVVLEVEAPPLREFTCPMGHAANQEGQCIPCLPGTSSPGGTSQCRTCDPGTHQPLEGQGSCESCPVGHYQANSGSVSCTPCDAGSSSRGQTGAFACSLCEPGQEAPRNGSQRCTPCKRGHYSENEGAATCLQCTGGKSTAEQVREKTDLWFVFWVFEDWWNRLQTVTKKHKQKAVPKNSRNHLHPLTKDDGTSYLFFNIQIWDTPGFLWRCWGILRWLFFGRTTRCFTRSSQQAWADRNSEKPMVNK